MVGTKIEYKMRSSRHILVKIMKAVMILTSELSQRISKFRLTRWVSTKCLKVRLDKATALQVRIFHRCGGVSENGFLESFGASINYIDRIFAPFPLGDKFTTRGRS